MLCFPIAQELLESGFKSVEGPEMERKGWRSVFDVEFSLLTTTLAIWITYLKESYAQVGKKSKDVFNPSDRPSFQSIMYAKFLWKFFYHIWDFLQMLVPNGIGNLWTLNRFRLVSVLFPTRLSCLSKLRLVMSVELTWKSFFKNELYNLFYDIVRHFP